MARQMKKARFFSGGLLVVALATALTTGCNNNPYKDEETNQKVLYTSLSEDPKSLDPSISYTVDEAYVVDPICPSYFKYHYLKRPFQLELNVGAREPVITPMPGGGQEYTFTIRKDLFFQDDPAFPGGKGRPVTAKDIVYSFQRMVDPDTKCPIASFFADKVVGWNEDSEKFKTNKKAQYDAPLAGVKVDPNDPYTFRVTLTKPYPQLRYLMAMHFTTPQAREAVEKYGKDEYARHPVGCGPMMMAEYKTKQRISLVRNPTGLKSTYPSEGEAGDAEKGLLKAAGRPLPIIDKIVFNIIKERTSLWNMFVQGYMDSASVNTGNISQVFTPVGGFSKELEAKGIQMKRASQTNVYYMGFNLKDPDFGGFTPEKRKLRQAIALSVSGKDYVDVLLNGFGEPAQYMLPPGIIGYDPTYKNPYREYDPDLKRAKQLLEEAGYKDGVDPKTGKSLVLHYDNSNNNAAARLQTGFIQKSIERLGIKVESRTTDYNHFQEKLHKNQHQFILYGWFADYPDPENFLFLLYGPNKEINYANYDSLEYNKLFEQMANMPDGPDRIAIIKKMRDMAMEECMWIPVYHSVAVSVSYDWQSNVKAHPIANDFFIYRDIDKEKRAQKRAEWNRPRYEIAFLPLLVILFGALPAWNIIQKRINRRIRIQPSNASNANDKGAS
jgi:oligopeptide transport system substrate-binding protein